MIEGELRGYKEKEGKVDLLVAQPYGLIELTPTDPAARAQLQRASPGDVVKATLDRADNPTTITNIGAISRPVPAGPRWFALLAAAATLVFLAALATQGNPAKLVVGFDQRYSNSQMQLAVWGLTALTVYLATVALRLYYLGSHYIGGVGIPANLLVLSGLSAFSFGGAKVITATKDQSARAANAARDPSSQPLPTKTAGTKNMMTDLFQNDSGVADLGDFQMILVTLIAVTIFLAQSFQFLAGIQISDTVLLPDVDTTLLASFGIGQGAYLLKKAALPPGQG